MVTLHAITGVIMQLLHFRWNERFDRFDRGCVVFSGGGGVSNVSLLIKCGKGGTPPPNNSSSANGYKASQNISNSVTEAILLGVS